MLKSFLSRVFPIRSDGILPWEPVCLAGLRLLVGSFLIWGTLDNLVSAERMSEFEQFLAENGFVYPAILAPLSVWAQFLCGLAFCLGFLTRFAGAICAFNFAIAVIFVDAKFGVRAAFPAAVLTALGLYFWARGAGKFSLDAWLTGRRSR